MGRKRKEQTKMVRIKLVDLTQLKAIARRFNISLPDAQSLLLKRKI